MLVELISAVALATAPAPIGDIDQWESINYPGCNTHRCVRRVKERQVRQIRARWWRVVRPLNGYLNSIAQCESGGRWQIATGNGFYGGLQFTYSSWRAVGGRGYPHQATPLEQKYRAVRLARLQGWGAWPNCS